MKIKSNKSWPEVAAIMIGSLIGNCITAAVLYFAWHLWTTDYPYFALLFAVGALQGNLQLMYERNNASLAQR